MKFFLTLITTIATTVTLSLLFSALCVMYGVPDFLSMLGSFVIGFFGSKIIFEWLNKPDPEMGEGSDLE